MDPSRRFSGLALSIAVLLTIFLILAVAAPPSSTTLLLSDLLQTFIVLCAAFLAARVARRSLGNLRQLWTLLGVALFIAAAAQAVETYYQNVPHLPVFTPWPSDILFLLWVTPAVMMLLPRASEERSGIEWQQLLDFAQVVALAFAAYLYFFYVPSRWQAEGPQLVDNVLRLQAVRDATLAVLFLSRAAVSSVPLLRQFLSKMAIFFLLAAGAELVALFSPRLIEPKASWNDVAWSVPYLFAVVFAASWKYDKTSIPPEPTSPLRIMVVSQIAIPFLVLFLSRRIAVEQFTLAWLAVAASFAISAARLVYTNEQQRRSEKALKASEERFRMLIQELHVGVALLGPDAKIQFANRAALETSGLSETEVLGKTTDELNLIALNEDGLEMPFLTRPAPRAIASGQPVRNEVMGWRKPGSDEIFWTLGEVVPVFRANGELDHLIASFSDITKRKEAEEKLHQLSANLLKLQDDERRRLGRELHDSLAQSVMAVNLDLARVVASEAVLDERTKRALADARETLRDMAREIRTLSYLLHPPVLDEMGLASAVKEYAGGFSERSGIAVELDIPRDFGRLPQQTETALFRIVQESLANIQKHSGSATAAIRLSATPGNIELEVCDHGRGIKKSALETRGRAKTRLGVGILGMRERMAQLGGRLELDSGSSGTTVRARVPVMIEAAHAPTHSGS